MKDFEKVKDFTSRENAPVLKHPAMIRALALIRKETRQVLRDQSTLTLGIILPIVLLLLFGYGLSLDVKMIPVAVVRDGASPVTRDLYSGMAGSPYFRPIMVNSWKEAEALLFAGKADAIVRRDIKDWPDGGEHIQIIVNGRDANMARIKKRYLEGAVSRWAAMRQSDESFLPNETPDRPEGQIAVESRVWYNHALESHYFLIPGVTALIMTLIGALLTALVVAREWERGTYEALIATAAGRGEIVMGKTVPYFVLGIIGLFFCLAASSLIFRVPVRGSLLLIVAGSGLYLLVSLGIGLFISALVKNQFLSSQIALIVSFLPTLMLSGFIFDLKSVSPAVHCFALLFPAAWYVELLQTLFLAGNIKTIVVRDFSVLSGFAVLFLGLAGSMIKKSLE